MTADELARTETIVNEKILEALCVRKENMSIDDAKKTGANALFDEKYGDVVRVVSMGEYSKEFCGGCHVDNTSMIGLFKLLSESGVSASIRRIEGITGRGVLEYIANKDAIIAGTAAVLKSNVNDITAKAEATVNELKGAQKQIDELRAKMAGGKVDGILNNAKTINGIQVATANMGDMSAQELGVTGDILKDKLSGAGVIVLASATDGKVNFIALANDDAVKAGAHAGNIIKTITAVAGGNGGGKPASARGAGKDVSKIDEALAAVEGCL